MPRGNNPEIHKEFADTYGVEGNAEKLIQRHRRSRTRELRTASLMRLDPVATNALDLDKVESALKLSEHEQVVSAAVRGGQVIAVVEVVDHEHPAAGRVRKAVIQRDKVGLTKAALKESRAALGMPEVAVGEAAYRTGQPDAAVTAAAAEDAAERERVEESEAKRQANADEHAKAADKERAKADKE